MPIAKSSWRFLAPKIALSNWARNNPSAFFLYEGKTAQVLFSDIRLVKTTDKSIRICIRIYEMIAFGASRVDQLRAAF
ncbi:unnamed protein product [Blepharisma stoltei]|uniref:Uncharacterized protein n=1 Tax=Blepharisma stoltei TaxID=1481888 RepID=A0AAU9JDI0_9CILI|nr:unnamed protein product [Blepharisma stoltei]